MSDEFNVDDIKEEEDEPEEEKFESEEIVVNLWRTSLHGAEIGLCPLLWKKGNIRWRSAVFRTITSVFKIAANAIAARDTDREIINGIFSLHITRPVEEFDPATPHESFTAIDILP